MKIEGFFSKIKTAKNAVDKLKDSGFKDATIDLNEHHDDDRNIQRNIAGTETGVSNSGIVLKSSAGNTSIDKSPLTASSPMVSGMGNFEEVADINCKVIVESGKDDAYKVKQIIRDMGGELENPVNRD